MHREYYVNSDNTQTRRFGASVYARLRGEEPPEGGYTGAYVTEIAEQARRDLPGVDALPFEEPSEAADVRDAEDRRADQGTVAR